MKAVIQRVRNASVKALGKVQGSLAWGLLVYLGVAASDSIQDVEWMAEKISHLRIFNDDEGKMNLSLLDIAAGHKNQDEGNIGVLAISQFTLLADTRRGRRPFYGDAADPEKANQLYECFKEKIREQGLICEAGIFQSYMDVSYSNDGPVTIILETTGEALKTP